METCVRGFSYMPENISIQLVENQELERTWRSRRRQLLKEQEEKIYQEFIKDTDVVELISKDDPYQFLQQLPEACIQELLQTELSRTTKELQHKEKESPEQAEPCAEENQPSSRVTFAEDTDRDDGDVFRVYDTDDNDIDKEDALSGISEDNYEGFDSTSVSPVTVREGKSQPSSPRVCERRHEKPPESVSAVIESSIYCAKVKDLRMKVRDEIYAIIGTLDRQDVMNIAQEEVTRRFKRSAEFSSRFNRIYMYQLKRQTEELERSTQRALPLAQHTQHHAQLARAAALHHHLLQALQVFHKSLEQTWCLRECAAALHALTQAVRAASALCAAAPAPAGARPAAALYDDDLLSACDNLEESVCSHSLRISEALSSAGLDSNSPSRKGKPKKKLPNPKSGASKSITDSRLSMYSMETLRMRPSAIATHFSSRRPLMRAGGHPPRLRARLPADTEICTMVETVDMQSSFQSRSASPPASARDPPAPSTHRRTNCASPRKRNLTSYASNNLSPKQRLRHSPQQLIKALGLIQGKDDRQVNPGSKKLDKIKKYDNNKTIANLRYDKNKTTPNSGSYIKGLDSARTDKSTCSPRSHEIDSKSFVKEATDNCAKGNVQDTTDMLKELGPARPVSSAAGASKEAVDGADSARSDERRVPRMGPAREVSRLLKQLCSGDSSGENVSGAKNAQLHLVSGSSPRPPPTTPQLLKILETTIKKQVPNPWFSTTAAAGGGARDPARHRMQLTLAEHTSRSHFHYRTQFLQHMLQSALYANSALGKPWELICSVSDKIIDEILLQCASEMQIKDVLLDLYLAETK